jgi:hypothetical protein
MAGYYLTRRHRGFWVKNRRAVEITGTIERRNVGKAAVPSKCELFPRRIWQIRRGKIRGSAAFLFSDIIFVKA